LNLNKVKKQSLFLFILLVFLVNTIALPAHGFIDDENQPTQEPVEIEEEEVDKTTIGEQTFQTNVNERNSSYTINIGNLLLASEVAHIPGVSLVNNVLYFDSNTIPGVWYTITGTTTVRTIEVRSNERVYLIFDNLNITNTPNSPVRLYGKTSIAMQGNSNLIRNDNIDSNLNHERAGIFVAETGSVTFIGHINDSLHVTTHAYGGAGIGGSLGSDVGDITVYGGVINARGAPAGAGIGTSGIFNGIVGDVNINIIGGSISANGGQSAAGIGTGFVTNGGTVVNKLNINISGGSIVATGDNRRFNESVGQGGAGIGLGTISNGSNGVRESNINISGGTVTASSGVYANGAGIGASRFTNTSNQLNIDISGGRVTASGRAPIIGETQPLDIGHTNTTNLNVNVQITGGSVQATNGTVHHPTNGSKGNSDPVSLVRLRDITPLHPTNPPGPIEFPATSSKGQYQYSALAHADRTIYAWLTTFDTVQTKSPTIKGGTPAIVEAPNTITTPHVSGEVTFYGEYVRKQGLANVTDVYFEWGTDTSYGNKVSVMSEIDTDTLEQEQQVYHTLRDIGGGTYNYRLVIEMGNISIEGENISFEIPSLAPSLDVTSDGITSTQATLKGIYDLNSHNFTEGYFEISEDKNNWFIPTANTTVRIIEGTGVDLNTGQINNASTMPTITLDGLASGTTYYYRFTIVSSRENKSTSDPKSFKTKVPITVEYVDINGNTLQPPTITHQERGKLFSASAPEISNYTNVGVIVDGEERDISKSFYINEAVSQGHTIQFVYDNTSTMVSLSVPARLIFASFASDGGALSAPNYKITNYSSLPVRVTLERFEGDADSLDGLTLVQKTPYSNNQIQLHLVGIDNFNTLYNLPNGILDNGCMGILAYKDQPNSSGEFTFEGNYRGRFGEQKYPRFEAVFTFSVELPDTLKS